MAKITLYPSRYIDCTCDLQEQIAPTAYHGLLPNGKRTVAFVERRDAELLRGQHALSPLATSE